MSLSESLATKTGKGFETQNGAKPWSEYVEGKGDPFRELGLYPFLREWLARTGIDKRDILLDACCGQGVTAAVLSETGAQVTGVDISQPLITQAQKKYQGHPNLIFEPGNVAELEANFIPHQFSTATCINGLFRLSPDEMWRLFQGFKTVVQPSGLILVTSVNPPHHERYAQDFLNEHRLSVPSWGMPSEFTTLVVGDEKVPGPQGREIKVRNAPFYMHPQENVYQAIRDAGLKLVGTPIKFAPLKLDSQGEGYRYISYSLQT